MALSAPKRLECCCCGTYAPGRQWWNRDTGYGLCPGCVTLCAGGIKPGEEHKAYGVRGIHFDLDSIPSLDAYRNV